ncbi:MAG: tetratricopeptide repeat protein [Candidatus Riflebacteria bacterium]|nr:tetratricopeptide repeat protein [Candidatus Riflebacteria bacterium]
MNDEILKKISTVLEQPDEYFSHTGALFFLGYINEQPDFFTVVSSRRRRSKVIDNTQIHFVFFPKTKIHHINRIEYSGVQISVSNLEKSLCDIFDYMEFSPVIEKIVELVAKLPLNVNELLNMAKFSDSALKRISFVLGLTGKICSADLPFDEMTRAPVFLCTREKESEQIWDKRFFLKYPLKILSTGLSPAETELDSGLFEWLELWSFEFFRQYFFDKKYCPIRGEPSSENLITEFTGEFISHLTPEELETLLESQIDLFYEKQLIQRKRVYPIFFNRFLQSNFHLLNHRKDEIIHFVRKNLFSNDLKRCENSLYIASVFKMEKELLECLNHRGYELLNCGRDRIVKKVIEDLRKRQFDLPFLLYTIAARIYANQGRYDDAITILEEGKIKFEKLEDSWLALGEIAYASANLYRMMLKFETAFSQLFIAKECFTQKNDIRGLGMVESSIGSLYFVRGNPLEAREHYLKSLTMMKKIGNRAAQAAIIGNLGIIEYDSGRYDRANNLLLRAISLQKSSKNNLSLSNLMLTRGKTLLQMGYLNRAFRLLKETYRLKQEISHLPGLHETYAFLGWVCELLGNKAASVSWWNLVPDDTKVANDPRVFYMVKTLRGFMKIFSGNLTEAQNHFENLRKISLEMDLPPLGTEAAIFGILLNRVRLRNSFSDISYDFPYKQLSKKTEYQTACSQRALNAILTELSKPSSEIDNLIVTNSIQQFLENSAYDVFWGFYAEKLIFLNLEPAKKFLRIHFIKSSKYILDHYKKVIPGFAKILTGISKYTTDEVAVQGQSNADLQISKEEKDNTILFNCETGKLSYRNYSQIIKPGSIPNRIFSNLILAFPNSIEIGDLFQSVWGFEFDSESDPPAVKSSLSRLRKIVASVNNGIKIKVKGISSSKGKIAVKFPCRWYANM